MLLEIKNRWDGRVIFSHDIVDNTMLATVKAAIASGADLSGADLSRADLSRADLSRADLSGADLSGADLSGADLSRADLSRAYLFRAYLSGAYLFRADLSGADLSGADLSRAYLFRAYLSGAYLSGADLSGADLSGADLSRADLFRADLKDIKEASLVLARTQITPSEGAFVGWKKLRGDVIARLVIPHDALRFNSYGSRKCRASKVFVHEMWEGETVFTGTAYDKHTGKTAYRTGEEVFPDAFDENKQVECSHGIHFFLTKEEAIAY